MLLAVEYEKERLINTGIQIKTFNERPYKKSLLCLPRQQEIAKVIIDLL